MTQRAPDVRYVTTGDGASIACWSVGQGARIPTEAAPGGVLVSDGTRQLLIGKPYTYAPVATRQIKGFEEPIGLYEVELRD